MTVINELIQFMGFPSIFSITPLFLFFSFTAYLNFQSYPCPFGSLTIESVPSDTQLNLFHIASSVPLSLVSLVLAPLLGFLGRNTTNRCGRSERAEWTPWIPLMCLPGKTALPNHSIGRVPYSFSLVRFGGRTHP